MPSPTPEQIAQTQTVIGLASLTYQNLTDRIAVLPDEVWVAQLADNDLWTANQETGKRQLKKLGNIEFFETSNSSTLGRIRRDSRVRFGISETIDSAAVRSRVAKKTTNWDW
jgi:hypothetical protein